MASRRRRRLRRQPVRVPEAHTHQTKITAASRKHGAHLPLWLDALIIIVCRRGGAVGYVLTHPSPHRSPDRRSRRTSSIQVGAGNYHGASKDVDPADQATALATMRPTPGSLVGPRRRPTPRSSVRQSGSGTSETVVIKACNASLACNPLPAIPASEIDGQWYVAWSLLLQTLATVRA